jgi:ERCC4-type nuclease
VAKNRVPFYTVIRDTRENTGYFFKKFDRCKGTITRKLDTGDYSIKGMEDKLCIERKASMEELALNLGQHKPTFMAEVHRMIEYDHKFIILEFSVEDLLEYPENSRIPPRLKAQVKMTGRYMLRLLNEIAIKYDVHVIFAGSAKGGYLLTSSLLKRINEQYGVK